MIKTRHAARAVAALSLFLLVPVAIGASGSSAAQPGTLSGASFHSATLGENIAYNVYLPAGYSSTAKRYPVLYLLHGRGDSMSAWTQVKGRLDQLIADGAIPADDRDHAGRSLEHPRELLRRLAVQGLRPQGHERRAAGRDGVHPGSDPARRFDVPHDRAIGTGASVGGYSMGGYGAIRYSLAHPDLFVSSIVLSPAVYIPKPPNDSSTREFGAFGHGRDLFSTHDLQEPELAGGA